MAKLRRGKVEGGYRYNFYCPGCKCYHSFDVRDDGQRPNWSFNGDMEKPTFSPSLLYPDRVCHLYVIDGVIQYLPDCTHDLAGKHVAMEDEN